MPTRAENVAYLTANCACQKGKAAVLNNPANYTDAEVEAMRLNAEADLVNGVIADRLREGVVVNGRKVLVDPLGNLSCNAFGPDDEDDEDDEDEDDDEAPKKPNPFKKKKGKPAMNNDNSPADVGEAVANHMKSLTPEQWIAMAPAAVQELLANARETVTEARRAMINEMVANIADPEARKAKANHYGQMSAAALKERWQDLRDHGLIGNRQQRRDPAADFDLNPPIRFDGAGGVVDNKEGDEQDWEDVPLLPPTINHVEDANLPARFTA